MTHLILSYPHQKGLWEGLWELCFEKVFTVVLAGNQTLCFGQGHPRRLKRLVLIVLVVKQLRLFMEVRCKNLPL